MFTFYTSTTCAVHLIALLQIRGSALQPDAALLLASAGGSCTSCSCICFWCQVCQCCLHMADHQLHVLPRARHIQAQADRIGQHH